VNALARYALLPGINSRFNKCAVVSIRQVDQFSDHVIDVVKINNWHALKIGQKRLGGKDFYKQRRLGMLSLCSKAHRAKPNSAQD